MAALTTSSPVILSEGFSPKKRFYSLLGPFNPNIIYSHLCFLLVIKVSVITCGGRLRLELLTAPLKENNKDNVGL
jgi:hypothetical protein